MHLFYSTFVAVIFAASGCAGSTPNAKSTDAGTADSTATDGKQAECNAVDSKFKQIDEAVKGLKGTAAFRALVPALDKMSKEFKESPMKTPGLDKATAELVIEADASSARMKELNAVFDDMEKVNIVLLEWQKKVEKASEDYDAACSKAPKEECETLSERVTKVPQLEGNEYARYAKELETFVKVMGEYEVKDAGLRTSWKSLLSAFDDGVKPMRRLSELTQELKKIDPGTEKLKPKFNQVREICGIPVRK
jgi:hypothetical protein